MTRVWTATVNSPVGPLALAWDAAGALRGLSFGQGLERSLRREYPGLEVEPAAPPGSLAQGLRAYFAGERAALASLPWSLDGAASAAGFAGAVWRSLLDVPAGTTVSYGELARRLGDPGAAQAVGVALNRNPLPLVLPCHRVIGADGSLTGFGGGLERKTWLLRHEGALLI